MTVSAAGKFNPSPANTKIESINKTQNCTRNDVGGAEQNTRTACLGTENEDPKWTFRGVEDFDELSALFRLGHTVKSQVAVPCPLQKVTKDFHDPRHLEEDQNLVTSSLEFRQDPTQQLKLPGTANHFRAEACRSCVEPEKIRMIASLAQLHHDISRRPLFTAGVRI